MSSQRNNKNELFRILHQTATHEALNSPSFPVPTCRRDVEDGKENSGHAVPTSGYSCTSVSYVHKICSSSQENDSLPRNRPGSYRGLWQSPQSNEGICRSTSSSRCVLIRSSLQIFRSANRYGKRIEVLAKERGRHYRHDLQCRGDYGG
jgi:hypothetical protein